MKAKPVRDSKSEIQFYRKKKKRRKNKIQAIVEQKSTARVRIFYTLLVRVVGALQMKCSC